MEHEKGEPAPGPVSETRAHSAFRLILSFSLLGSLIWLVSCAAPGEPIERKPQVPTAITDLAARQQGNDGTPTFRRPKDTVEHRPVKTIPPATIVNYSEKNHIRVINSLDSNDLSPHVGWTASYTVRTRASVKKESADSNRASVRVFPAPDPIADLHAEVAHNGIILKWAPPQGTIAGPTPSIAAFHVYRAEVGPELQPSTPPPPSGAVSGVPILKVPLVRVGESTDPTFQDKQIEFGKTYVYSVRSLLQYSEVALESADSNLVIATPRAIFPPEGPQNLTVVLVPAQGENSAFLDLSWAISPETDIAGYNVYRSEQDGVPGRRLNSELLLTPAFRDMNAVPGRQYVYTATAVDRAGNESPTSAPASGSIPVEGQPRP